MTPIDEDFKKLAEQINAKVKEATAALREANRLVEAAGLPALIYSDSVSTLDDTLDALSDEEYDQLEEDEEWDGFSSPLEMKMKLIDVSDLEYQLEAAGWSTSSSYC